MRTVELLVGEQVVGVVEVEADAESEPMHVAAAAREALTFRVDGQQFSTADIEEWWA